MIDFLEVKPNIEAERSVIGAILVDSDRVMPEAEEIVGEDDFLVTEYRTIFKTCAGYFVDGKNIDFVILLSQLGDEYKTTLAECIQSMPSIENWKEYARIVAHTAKKHRALGGCQQLGGMLAEGYPLSECQEISVRLCEHLNEQRHDDTVSAKEGFVQYYSGQQRVPEYLRTGFTGIDRHTYIGNSDFVVIGARPSVGKTALTLQMMLTMSKAKRVAYFSLETRNNNLFGRMSSSITEIPLSILKSHDNIDFERLAAAMKVFETRDFYTIEAAGWTVGQIKAKAVQLGADVVFVDYLGLVNGHGKTPYERVSGVSIDLHTMAVTCKKTVIALCQLNRAGNGEPDITHLRESGQIEQDAEIIMLLHAPEGIENPQRKVIIAKNKEGVVGRVNLSFNGSIQKFGELEERYG